MSSKINRFFAALDVALILTWCTMFAYMYDVVCVHNGSALFYLPFTPFVLVLFMVSAAFAFEYYGIKAK